jgi:pseudaminic acid biosynthesis-associated methylase
MKQVELWQGAFGEEYTERNTYNPEQLDQFYLDIHGVTRSELNRRFLSDLELDSVFEVGSNVGNQLRLLQSMGYQNLYGLELQHYAVEKAKALTEHINIIQGSAFDIPFKDKCFDLVFTSGVLIHISPNYINQALHEIYRVSRKYIWGLEYYADEYIEINYRGNNEAMWKGNYAKMLLDLYPDLKVVKTEKISYEANDNIDMMYLLEKGE